MSSLPQRRKTTEEIAKLRESLGVPPAPDAEDSASGPVPDAALVAHVHEADVVPPAPPEPLSPLPAGLPPGAKPIHSLKRSEALPAAGRTEPAPAPPAAAAHPEPGTPKPVRSLKRAEREAAGHPRPPHEPAGDSSIPLRRHSDRELNEIRRRGAIAMLQPHAPDIRLQPAHPAWIAAGYLPATAAASCFVFYGFPLAATALCLLLALAVAASLVLKRPLSRHHAAFIAIIALLVAVFAALHYFPQLRHAP